MNPENLKKDLAEYQDKLGKFINGNLTHTEFKIKRVTFGIYEQRTKDTFMVRIRIPGGVLNSTQLRALAILSSTYGDGKLHVSTRQDIQLHYIKLNDTVAVMTELISVNLGPKGGGGNTVRNITACPYSDNCPHESFDVTPFACGLTDLMMAQNNSFSLPRKYKIAFSGCVHDCGFAMVNDLGFIAIERNGNPCFTVYSGGGMGAYSRPGILLLDFIEPSEVGRVAEAVKRLFDKHGNRKNKHAARLRFVLDKIGPDEFRKLFHDEYQSLKTAEDFIVAIKPKKTINSDDTRPVLLRLPYGVLPANQAVIIAELSDTYANGNLRTTQEQNLLLPSVPVGSVARLKQSLTDNRLHYFDQPALTDIITCPGSSTCQLGICLARGLSGALLPVCRKHAPDPLLNGLRIRISGCPNACGAHPIADIGFSGAAKRIGDRLMPAYKIWLAAENSILAREYPAIPAKAVPGFLDDFLSRLATLPATSGRAAVATHGENIMKDILPRYETDPDYETNPSYFTDFGADTEFSLAGRGAGECGAGVLDMIDADLKLSREYLARGETRDSVIASCRALLVTRGIDSTEVNDIIAGFQSGFIDEGFISRSFASVLTAVSAGTSVEASAAVSLLTAVETLYRTMDDSLKFKPVAETTAPAKTLNLRNVKCPINYVKAKLALEKMNSGDCLELLLDDGEPINNVPASLKNDGHTVESITPRDTGFSVKVRKQ